MMGALELINSAAFIACVGVLFRTESRITRLEAIIETLTKRGQS